VYSLWECDDESADAAAAVADAYTKIVHMWKSVDGVGGVGGGQVIGGGWISGATALSQGCPRLRLGIVLSE